MPGSFPDRPPREGKRPGNEVGDLALPVGDNTVQDGGLGIQSFVVSLFLSCFPCVKGENSTDENLSLYDCEC